MDERTFFVRYALPGTLLVLYASVILYTEAFIKSTHFLDSLYDPAAPQRLSQFSRYISYIDLV